MFKKQTNVMCQDINLHEKSTTLHKKTSSARCVYIYIRNLIVVHGSKLFNSLMRQDLAKAKKTIQRTTQRHLQNAY